MYVKSPSGATAALPRLALLALLAMAAACGGHRAGTVDPQAAAMLEVENQSFYDVTIYIVRSGLRTRLGTVQGSSAGVFEIPRTFVNPGLPIRFLADPIGPTPTPYSQEIPVWPGDTIRLRIPPG